MDNDEYLTIDQFAHLLRVHPNTIRNAIKSKRICAFRIGKGKKGAYRIAKTEIMRMAEFDLQEYIENEVQKRLGVK